MRYLAFILILAFTQLFALDATIKLEKDVDDRVRVLISDNSDILSNQSKEVSQIFKDDMTISGHFVVEEGYKTKNRTKSQIKYILKFNYRADSGVAKLSVNLIDKISGRSIFDARYNISVLSRYPFLVHKAVIEMNNALGFKSINWLNRYIIYARYTGKKQTEVVLSDFTFHYRKVIMRGALTLFPCWGDKSQKVLYYSDYNGELPILKRLNLYTGKIDTITKSQGMLACSDSSSDGNRILLTMAPEGQADIYEYNLLTNSAKRVTFFSGIDVNGKYLKGDNKIVFVSNRFGYPNIFSKNIEGRDVEQLVFVGRNNNSCDAFEDKVVFVGKANSNTYNIYYMNSDGSGIRPLTSGGVNQFPKFSSDGSIVMYFDKYNSTISYVNVESGEFIKFKLPNVRIQSIDW